MRWYYVTDAHERLAVEENELPVLVRTGLVRPQTLVWHEGRAEWAAAGELKPELFGDNRPMTAVGVETPVARLAMRPLLRRRAWLGILMLAVFARAAVDLPAALARVGRDAAVAAGVFARVAFLVAIGCVLLHWLLTLERAARTGTLDDLRGASRAGGRVLAVAGLAAVLYLLSLAYRLASWTAGEISGL